MEIKINLVPPSKKEEIGKNKRLKMMIKAEIALTIIIIGFFVVLLGFKYSLQIGLNAEMSLNKEIETADQFGKIKNYDAQFSQANEWIKQIALIDQSQLYWSRIFKRNSQLISAGITIKSLSTDQHSITLAGLADTRENLIEFKDKLEGEACFSDVTLPLSNLVDKTDVEFEIVYTVSEKCLKK